MSVGQGQGVSGSGIQGQGFRVRGIRVRGRLLRSEGQGQGAQAPRLPLDQPPRRAADERSRDRAS